MSLSEQMNGGWNFLFRVCQECTEKLESTVRLPLHFATGVPAMHRGLFPWYLHVAYRRIALPAKSRRG
ncbi:hypothetical protein BO99DRAFT_244590 [Aspergillus violaceofuscus CBS 115571]|uniref:Uncharacterized protein n=1 Tax=Aspergillus violaceofuscus (strain CBS 115571) TaxID=1450538 RepID=A0A2V5GWB1_ASPV1|nr:hypothetical protein BO99DRAFT_244590 [Aspergillus violaceofuscus CBS 115571]